MTALLVSILVSLPIAPPTIEAIDAAAGIEGRATWYGASGMIAAAGPGLRAHLGKDWRGSRVAVSSGKRTVFVTVSDWCDCRGRGSERLIDLSDDAFAQLAPLSAGVIRVSIARASRPSNIPEPPATDTNQDYSPT